MKDGVIQSLALPPRSALAAVAAMAAMLFVQFVNEGLDRILPGLVLAAGLGWGAAIDLERMRLPDPITLGLVVAGLMFAWRVGPDSLLDGAIGCCAGYAAGWLLAEVFWRLRGREGLGLGDVKLLAAAGAWLGWRGLPLAVLAASMSALAIVLALAILKRVQLKGAPRIPFGPFLAAGIWFAWVTGPV